MKEDSKAASPNDLVLLICHMNVCQAGFGRRSGWEKTFSLLFYHHISAHVSSAGTKEKHIGCRNSCQAWLKILKHSLQRCEAHVHLQKDSYSNTKTTTSVWGWNYLYHNQPPSVPSAYLLSFEPACIV